MRSIHGLAHHHLGGHSSSSSHSSRSIHSNSLAWRLSTGPRARLRMHLAGSSQPLGPNRGPGLLLLSPLHQRPHQQGPLHRRLHQLSPMCPRLRHRSQLQFPGLPRFCRPRRRLACLHRFTRHVRSCLSLRRFIRFVRSCRPLRWFMRTRRSCQHCRRQLLGQSSLLHLRDLRLLARKTRPLKRPPRSLTPRLRSEMTTNLIRPLWKSCKGSEERSMSFARPGVCRCLGHHHRSLMAIMTQPTGTPEGP